MAGGSRSPSDGSGKGLDLGLDALLEDDAGRGAAAGLGAARKLGGAALDAESFQPRGHGPARATGLPGPADPAVYQLEGTLETAPPARRPRLLLVAAIGLALLAAAAVAVIFFALP